MVLFTFTVICNCRINSELRSSLKLAPEHLALVLPQWKLLENLPLMSMGMRWGMVIE